MRGGDWQEPSPFNLSNAFLLLLVFSLAYGGWKYVPTYWQRYQVMETVGDTILGLGRANPERLRQAIVEEVGRIVGPDNLVADDVIVTYGSKSNKVQVTFYYDYTVEHLFGYRHEGEIKIDVERHVYRAD